MMQHAQNQAELQAIQQGEQEWVKA
jgi:hypothetical protein